MRKLWSQLPLNRQQCLYIPPQHVLIRNSCFLPIRNNIKHPLFNMSMISYFSLTLNTFTNASPCHQHLGSCQGGILLPVSGMPLNPQRGSCISQYHYHCKYVCLLEPNTGMTETYVKEPLSVVNRNYTCLPDNTKLSVTTQHL